MSDRPDLSAIHETPPKGDRNAEHQETADFKNQLNCDMMEAEVNGLRQDIKERKIYATRIFKLICCWVFGLFSILFLQGLFDGENRLIHGWFFSREFGFSCTFHLSDSVLIAVVSGTTVSVFGIFIIVAKYLFQKK
jgi:hypothetical protein